MCCGRTAGWTEGGGGIRVPHKLLHARWPFPEVERTRRHLRRKRPHRIECTLTGDSCATPRGDAKGVTRCRRPELPEPPALRKRTDVGPIGRGGKPRQGWTCARRQSRSWLGGSGASATHPTPGSLEDSRSWAGSLSFYLGLWLEPVFCCLKGQFPPPSPNSWSWRKPES